MFDFFEVIALLFLTSLLSGSIGVIASYLIMKKRIKENMSDILDALGEKFVNIIEFAIVIGISWLIQYTIYTQLLDAGTDAFLSIVISWSAFFCVILAYYGKIRAIIYGYV